MKTLSIVAVLSLPFVTGCMTIPAVYVHATKTQEQFQADRFDCDMIARQALQQGYSKSLFTTFNPIAADTDRCLREKYGWKGVVTSSGTVTASK